MLSMHRFDQLSKRACWCVMLLSVMLPIGLAKAYSPAPDITVFGRSPIEFPWVVMGIMRRSHPNGDEQDGVLLAKYTVSLLDVNRTGPPRFNKRKALAIFVFSDEHSGQAFTDYQLKRHHQMLQAADFRNLVGLWPKVSVCYLYEHGKGKVLLPSRDPEGWWQVKPLYDPDAPIPHPPAKPTPPIVYSQEVPHEPSYITNQRLNQQVLEAQKDMDTTGLDLPPDTLQAAHKTKPTKKRSALPPSPR